MTHFSFTFALTCLFLLFSPISSRAFEVQEVVSSLGIKAWLVEAHDVPILSMTFSMPGGRNFEPKGKEGAHGLMTDMMIEGAGTFTSEEFKAGENAHDIRASDFSRAVTTPRSS